MEIIDLVLLNEDGIQLLTIEILIHLDTEAILILQDALFAQLSNRLGFDDDSITCHTDYCLMNVVTWVSSLIGPSIDTCGMKLESFGKALGEAGMPQTRGKVSQVDWCVCVCCCCISQLLWHVTFELCWQFRLTVSAP